MVIHGHEARPIESPPILKSWGPSKSELIAAGTERPVASIKHISASLHRGRHGECRQQHCKQCRLQETFHNVLYLLSGTDHPWIGTNCQGGVLCRKHVECQSLSFVRALYFSDLQRREVRVAHGLS